MAKLTEGEALRIMGGSKEGLNLVQPGNNITIQDGMVMHATPSRRKHPFELMGIEEDKLRELLATVPNLHPEEASSALKEGARSNSTFRTATGLY